MAALGSSIFIAFLTPASYTARSWNLIGSHIISALIGIGFYYLICQFADNQIAFILFSAASVSLSMFMMVITNTEHPPAAGTSLGFALDGNWVSFLFITVSVIALAIIKRLLSPWLHDLV